MKRNTGAQAAQGFTLVELLVVMMILGFLFALLMPAIGRARQAAARNQARQELSDIVAAHRAYFSEYARYPSQINTSSDQVYTDTNYRVIIDILRGPLGNATTAQLNDHNPQKIVFLSVNERSLETVDGNTLLMDPWGNRYQVAADWNMNNRVTINAQGYQTIWGRPVVAWSWGERGQDARNDPRQHIKSWTDDPNDTGRAAN